jgi:hypothetical protein
MNVAQVGNSAVIAAVGVDGSLRFYWQTIGTAPWHSEQVAVDTSGGEVFTHASVARVGDSSAIAAAGSDDSL